MFFWNRIKKLEAEVIDLRNTLNIWKESVKLLEVEVKELRKAAFLERWEFAPFPLLDKLEEIPVNQAVDALAKAMGYSISREGAKEARVVAEPLVKVKVNKPPALKAKKK